MSRSSEPHDSGDAIDRLIEEGSERLDRSWRALLVTGYIGGTDIALGLLAYLAVRQTTGSILLGGLAFSVGLVALLLGRSELFTEDFLVPVTAVAAKRASWGALIRLWAGTLLTNLLGGWMIMWVVTAAFPQLHDLMIDAADHFIGAPLDLRAFALAVLGGLVITLMTRMHHGTTTPTASIVASVIAGFLLVGLELFHSVVESLLVFGAIHTGRAPFGYLDWLPWFGFVALGNMAGGLLLVTLLRLARNRDRLRAERRSTSAPEGPPDDSTARARR